LDLYYEIGTGNDFYPKILSFAIELKYSVGISNVLRTSIHKHGDVIVPDAQELPIFTDATIALYFTDVYDYIYIFE